MIWIGEEADPDEAGRESGRFTVHGSAEQAPNNVELGAALAWARARSDLVAVRIDDEVFSAGSRRFHDLPSLPDPLPVIHPRPAGTPWHGGQQTRSWEIGALLITTAGDAEIGAVVASLRTGPVRDASAKRTSTEEVRVDLEVVERGIRSATTLATRALDQAMTRHGIRGYIRRAGSI